MQSKTWIGTLVILLVGTSTLFLAPIFNMQEDKSQMPFAHAIAYPIPNTSFATYYSQVINIPTGDIIYEFNSDGYTCPLYLPPNRRWFVYQASETLNNLRDSYHVLNLETLETEKIVELSNADMTVTLISIQNDKLIYLSSFDDAPRYDQMLYEYDLQTKATVMIASFSIKDDKVSVQLKDQATQIFALRDDLSVYRVEASVDGNFLILFNDDTSDEMIVLNTKTAIWNTIEKIGRYEWNPQLGILLYYVGDKLRFYDANNDKTTVVFTRHQTQNQVDSFKMSPDARYIAYLSEAPNTMEISFHILETTTGETSEFKSKAFFLTSEMVWIDETRLIYAYAHMYEAIRTDDYGYQLDNIDLWLYDAETDQTTQITDTPDVKEAIKCTLG